MPKRIQMTRQRPWRAENPDAVIVALAPIIARELVAAEKRGAAKGWGEACRAVGWALANGDPGSAANHVASNNPYLTEEEN